MVTISLTQWVTGEQWLYVSYNLVSHNALRFAAIALSLEEEKKKGGKSSSLYPNFNSAQSSSATSSKPRELRKVWAATTVHFIKQQVLPYLVYVRHY